MTDLRAALLARCDELERLARAAADGFPDGQWTAAENLTIGGWAVYPPGQPLGTGAEVADFCRESAARLIAAFDPAAVVMLVAGAREMCEIHAICGWNCQTCDCIEGWPCRTLRAVARMLGVEVTDG